jgi:hypothetical protein
MQSKLQKQRQEMRAQREKNLKEFKSLSNNNKSHCFNESSKPKEPLTSVEDRSAIKIQAAWRGHAVRKSNLIKTKFLLINYKKLESCATQLRQSLKKLELDHQSLIQFNKANCGLILSVLENYLALDKSSDGQMNVLANQILPKKNDNSSSYDLNLIQENLLLRDKITQLESRCSKLESSQLGIHHQHMPEIHAPLRVRLQKLTEKTVALKWNHNPKNTFLQLTGYNIYINGEVCGTMKPSELCASIDGIQTEGEYKMSVRSFMGEAESPDSNQVITRVKKKPTEPTTTTTTETLSSSSSDYDNEDTSTESSQSKKSPNHSDSNISIEKKLNSNSSLTAPNLNINHSKSKSNASIASTVSFECQVSDDNPVKNVNFDKLIQNIAPVVSKNFSNSPTSTSSVKPKSHVTLFANFANSVKFSSSEPNLSNHNLNRTDSSNATNESVSSLLRHSIAINDDSILDQEELDENNFPQPYSQYGASFDISELNSNSNE